MRKLLIIDDFFGRKVARGRSFDRLSLCRRLGLTEYEEKDNIKEGMSGLVGMLSFYRGQRPEMAKVGDIVENDLQGCLDRVGAGAPSGEPWHMLILDLCFYTGEVTDASNSEFAGFPEGRPGDDDPECFFGLQILAAVKEQFPSLPVVIFSAYVGEKVRSRADDLGALGFISRDDPEAHTALSALLAGVDKQNAIVSSGPKDCRGLLELARTLPMPTLTELRNVLPLLKELETVLLRRALHGVLARQRGGRISLLPALKLISGEEALTTSQAADLLKRLVHQTRPHGALLLADPLIREAYEMSVRLRPGATKRAEK